MIGRVLSGLYKVDSRIGEGGMGTVYMAFHVHLERPFAVKVLSEKVAANKQAVDRLLMEAKAASSIDHENIVDVVSFDATEDGKVFLVMEMLEGTSLADLVDKGPMKVERALPIALQVCEALHAAHERNIVHRDLKPDNVFIVRKKDADFVKVLDFGISKVKTAEAEQVRMTRTGQLVGTPLYMSPEQAKGEADVDRRADVYALGVMLFEMLAGEPPFEGSNYFQLLWKHGNEAPPELSDKRAEVPPGVAAAVMKALSKSPDDRFQTMAEMGAALVAGAPGIALDPDRLVSLPPRQVVAGTPVASATPTPEPAAAAPGRAWRWGLAGAVLAIIGVAGFAMSGAFGGSDSDVGERPSESDVGDRESDVADRSSESAVGDRSSASESETETETETLPIGEPPPALVTVRFESTPTGATVVGPGDETLGVTPFAAELPTGEPITVRFTRRGHRPREEDVVPEDGATVSVRLRARSTESGGSNDFPSIRMNL
ncbi:MAG: serine/threonine protein kinase [Deltaproteobacteria bacterium]|nr:serine/threonine protein kinase [Deltaproteobacteria bacterium]